MATTELQYGCMPSEDTPTVEMRVGARYLTHWGTSAMECVAYDASSERPYVVQDTANGEQWLYHADGRRWRSNRTFMDLIAEVAE